MKKIFGNLLVGLSFVIGTGSVLGQTVPPGLIDNLRVVGIQKYEVIQTTVAYVKDYPAGAGIDVLAFALSECGSTDTAGCYIIKMKVSIENTGDNNVLIKDPQLDVVTEQPAAGGEPENIIVLGKARLVRENSKTWQPIAQILCPEGAQKAKETQHTFEVVVGPRDLEHAQRMLQAFNMMNSQDRKWLLSLRGTAKVGWRSKGKGDSSAMVFSSAPVEIALNSKPTMPEQIPFPK